MPNLAGDDFVHGDVMRFGFDFRHELKRMANADFQRVVPRFGEDPVVKALAAPESAAG